MSHAAAEADLQAELTGELPSPYCMGGWKQMVLGLALSATAISVFSVHSYLKGDATDALVAQAQAAPAQRGMGPRAGRGKGPRAAVAAVAGNGFVTQAMSASNVRPVAATRRTSFNRAAAAIRPSVVGIRVSLGPGAEQSKTERVGSGVVVDPAGYAVTCRHVVVGATAIVASRFREPQRWLPAQVVAVEGDLALLRILDKAPFPPAALADSEQVQVGDSVLAVGHPFGLGLTVTAGIVGQRHATLAAPGGGQYTDLLQTDAPINEGSSGGPLVNVDGEVVGLNTAIYSPTGVFSGAGFAIPGNRMRQFLSRVLAGRPQASGTTGPVAPRGGGGAWGVGLVDLTPSLSAELACPGSGGVVVSSIVPGSPAEAARLARGDVIVAIAGQPVSDIASVGRIRSQLSGRGTITVQVWRRGRTQTLVLGPGLVSAG